MISEGLFAGSIHMLEKALDLRALKHNLILTNIANIDTPHYQASDVNFEKEMEKALSAKQNSGLIATQPGHFSTQENQWNQVTPQKADSGPTISRGDGNTVNIDQTMVSLSENSVMYNALVRILAKKFQGLESAIAGGEK